MRAVQLKNDSYEAGKLEALHQNLIAARNSGVIQDYEIRVDDFPVLSRNNDPSRFMSYAEFVNPNTKYISVLLYRPNSNVSDKYFFHLQPNPFSTGLNGIEPGLSQMENEAKQKERLRKEVQFEQLETENVQLKKQVEELEESVIRLYREKEQIIEEGRQGVKGLLKDAVEIFGINKFSRAFTEKSETVNGTPDAQSSFKRAEEAQAEEAESIVIGEEDKGAIQLLKDLKQRVGEVELANLMHLLDLVSENPRSIPFAIKQVGMFIKSKPKT